MGEHSLGMRMEPSSASPLLDLKQSLHALSKKIGENILTPHFLQHLKANGSDAFLSSLSDFDSALISLQQN